MWRPVVTKEPKQHRTPWTAKEINTLKQLAKENTPTRVIALKMERTPAAVQGKASSEGISLKPTNQRPYNRQKKK
ncbi:hypothetical protein EN780_14770 [Mesorhizobium sp. M4B.F.Ca.ET.089.01.1.1]|nr:hypothetical protein EN780_14770 [Mesorhizobium sp. M4B.F.Ca.ET.089.01.1.1]